MRVFIVDDEKANIENLEYLLHHHVSNVHIVGTATTIEDAFHKLSTQNIDLLLLDILMGGQHSFELLKQIPNRSFEVVFVTAYDQFGIQAIKFSAIDYLLKPVDIEELRIAIQKVQTSLDNKQKNRRLDYFLDILERKGKPKIVLPLTDELRYIDVEDIIHCESNNTYTFFFLVSNEKILVSKPLKEYETLLTQYGFLRTHQSHLVNTAFVKSMKKEDGGYLLLKDGTHIPISKSKKEMVKNVLANIKN